MSKFVITGGNRVSGEITAYANKNSVLPILAATLLTDKPCIIKNVPKIRDVSYMLELLQFCGARVQYLDDTTVEVRAEEILQTDLPVDFVKKIRASVLLLGALVNRAGTVSMNHPGGDVIGRRSIEPHLHGFEQLGISITRTDDLYTLKNEHAKAGTVFLEEISVTATENLLLASGLLPGETVIQHAASEPHVQEVCKVLAKMGATVEGIGTDVIRITGKKNLNGFEHYIEPDHIEVGTWAVLAGVTKGDITVKNVNPVYLGMILLLLKRIGLTCTLKENIEANASELGYTPFDLIISADTLIAPEKIDAYPWPGIPTDLISVLIVLATQCQGITLVRDWMFEGRMFFVDKLITMGAQIILCDPHRVVVSGPSHLYGKQLESPDLRAGMALVLAALAAEGQSIISNIEHIERGYAHIVERLTHVGVAITRIEE